MTCEDQLSQCSEFMARSAGVMKAVAADCQDKFQSATDTTSSIMQTFDYQITMQQEMVNRAALTSVLLILLCLGLVAYMFIAYFRIRKEYLVYISTLHEKLNKVLAKQPEAANANIRFHSEATIPKFKWFRSLRWVSGFGLLATLVFGFIV